MAPAPLTLALALLALSVPLGVVAQPPSSAGDAQGRCTFVELPAIPFFWDPSCTKVEGLGCKADSLHQECRFCGEPPYASVPCPQVHEAHAAQVGQSPLASASWIVVGGGAAGCAAAAALADAGEDVVLFERGPSDKEIYATQQASTWPYVVNSEAVQPLRFREGVWGAVAKVLGGGTSVNGGYSFEEHPDWLKANLGEDVDLGALYDSYRYLAENLTHPVQPNDYGHAWVRALAEAGHGGLDPQPQTRWVEGSWVPHATMNTSQPGWPRRGPAMLLHERAQLPNLRVVTRALVHRVLFEGNKAVGVRVSLDPPVSWRARQPWSVHAAKGVLVAAGALLTPQILQLSGVGEQALLQKLQVQPVVANLPVGRNFVDRLVLSLGVKANSQMPLSIGYAVAVNTTLGMTFETEAGGQITSEFAIASLALNEPSQRNELLRNFFKFIFRLPPHDQPSPLADTVNKMMQVLALQHKTYSRGSIEAVSQDPSVPPSISGNYYSDPRDYYLQGAAMTELLKIAGTQALSGYVSRKTESQLPETAISDSLKCAFLGPSWQGRGSENMPFAVLPCLPDLPASDAEWASWYRKNAISSYHYFGTAAVGSVLETGDFTVKGTQGLHVIDASIFPDPPRINPQHTIMAVGHYVGTKLAAKARADTSPSSSAHLVSTSV